MWSFNRMIDALLDLVLRPFHLGPPLVPLSLFAVLSGLVMLMVFRYTSNQLTMKQAKNHIKAHLLELRLFKDDLAVIMTAQKQILLSNLVYLQHVSKPIAIMLIPMALLLIHLDAWFGFRPLQPGEAALVTVRVADPTVGTLDQITLQAESGLAVETPPLRIPATHEVTWRIRAREVGSHTLRIQIAERTVHKAVEIANGLVRLSPYKVLASFWPTVLRPGEPPIPKDAGVRSVAVHYPVRFIPIFGWQTHWLVVFFILSIACGYVLKGWMGVEL